MKEARDFLENKPQSRFALGQWPRSAGRVIWRRAVSMDLGKEDSRDSVAHADLADIYRKLLQLQDEENRDLNEALSYGLKLLESQRGEKYLHNHVPTSQSGQ